MDKDYTPTPATSMSGLFSLRNAEASIGTLLCVQPSQRNTQEYVSYEAAQIAFAENDFTNARTNCSPVIETAKQPSGKSSPAPASAFGAIAVPQDHQLSLLP
ncbi:hypothetical protein BKA70DRAFT_1419493 [Coprinopsis sp. MPI-PUGE-AT-0042]|nr:hypothetical protein BKA70DRAFT_1419493 [Coprinopsis sp. MPI-PUGE-AT-0042]